MQRVSKEAPLQGNQTRLWIDTDITIGTHGKLMAFRDVDDGYALGALFRSQEVDIVGLSSTRGNTDDIAITTAKAKEFTARFGPNSLTVTSGAAVNFESDQYTKATLPDGVKALAEQLKQGRLTILAIGALTNIALLLKYFPELSCQIEQIICVAGRRSVDQHFISGSHQLRPFRDLNFEFDVPAFRKVLESDVELTLVPFEVCQQVWIHFKDLEQLAESNQLSRYLAEHSLGWYLEWKAVFGAKQGFNPFDMIAAAFAINPLWFQSKQWPVAIVEAQSDTEHNQDKPYLLCHPDLVSQRKVNYLVEIAPSASETLLERIEQNDISAFVLGLSHINVIVDDVDGASEYYQRVLGFKPAFDEQGQPMDYRGVSMAQFNQDAGLAGQDVIVDVLFVKHPYAHIYLELMKYHKPIGNSELPPQPRTYDLGGPRHIALEVSNCNEVFKYLKAQPDAKMIDPRSSYHPEKLDGFPITFFYWIDKYGIQWEIEEGRRVGTSRGIV
ncbi:nucleoside hydrolase [Vibrio maritimus]|uniref:nucleoside hydrolase n=1 Tax=Vibrio maritimus TaxID=990268 RepID=UPI0040689894